MKIIVAALTSMLLIASQPAGASEWMGSFFGNYANQSGGTGTVFGSWTAKITKSGKATVTVPGFGTNTGQINYSPNGRNFTGTFGLLGSVSGKTNKEGDKVKGTWSGVLDVYTASGTFKGNRNEGGKSHKK